MKHDRDLHGRDLHGRDLHSEAAALPLRLHNQPARSFDTLPRSLFGITAAAYGFIMLSYWLTFGAHAQAALMVAVSTAYVAMVLGIPWTMARLGETMLRERHGGRAAPGLSDFLSGTIATRTGPMSGWSAAVQVALIPIGLAFATLGICIIIALSR